MSMIEVCTQEDFRKSTAGHQMTILQDDGTRRHVRFKRPNSWGMYFDLLTWPGCLCVTGDMGTYLFRRLDDMFEFFRTDRRGAGGGQTLTINPRYWGEKLQAIDKSGGYREWCREKFVTRIQEDFAEYLADREPENVQEIGERFHTDVLDCLENAGKETAYQAAMSFEVDGQCPFQDWWEVDTDEYTYHFLWCCYAIVWGIQQYDQSRAIIVDNFAGSGAWLGIEWALGDFVTAIGATATLGVFMLSKDPAVIAALHSMSPWVGQNVEVLSWLVMGLLMTAFVTAPFVLNDRDWQVGESQLARVGWIGLIVVRVLAFLVALVAILGMLGLLFRSLTQ